MATARNNNSNNDAKNAIYSLDINGQKFENLHTLESYKSMDSLDAINDLTPSNSIMSTPRIFEINSAMQSPAMRTIPVNKTRKLSGASSFTSLGKPKKIRRDIPVGIPIKIATESSNIINAAEPLLEDYENEEENFPEPPHLIHVSNFNSEISLKNPKSKMDLAEVKQILPEHLKQPGITAVAKVINTNQETLTKNYKTRVIKRTITTDSKGEQQIDEVESHKNEKKVEEFCNTDTKDYIINNNDANNKNTISEIKHPSNSAEYFKNQMISQQISDFYKNQSISESELPDQLKNLPGYNLEKIVENKEEVRTRQDDNNKNHNDDSKKMDISTYSMMTDDFFNGNKIDIKVSENKSENEEFLDANEKFSGDGSVGTARIEVPFFTPEPSEYQTDGNDSPISVRKEIVPKKKPLKSILRKNSISSLSNRQHPEIEKQLEKVNPYLTEKDPNWRSKRRSKSKEYAKRERSRSRSRSRAKECEIRNRKEQREYKKRERETIDFDNISVTDTLRDKASTYASSSYFSGKGSSTKGSVYGSAYEDFDDEQSERASFKSCRSDQDHQQREARNENEQEYYLDAENEIRYRKPKNKLEYSAPGAGKVKSIQAQETNVRRRSKSSGPRNNEEYVDLQEIWGNYFWFDLSQFAILQFCVLFSFPLFYCKLEKKYY